MVSAPKILQLLSSKQFFRPTEFSGICLSILRFDHRHAGHPPRSVIASPWHAPEAAFSGALRISSESFSPV